MTEFKHIAKFRLAHEINNDNVLTISHIEHPHGKFSDPIVTIGVMKDGEFTNKLEVPYENIDELIVALTKAKKIDTTIMHNHLHDELMADVGGGQ